MELWKSTSELVVIVRWRGAVVLLPKEGSGLGICVDLRRVQGMRPEAGE